MKKKVLAILICFSWLDVQASSGHVGEIFKRISQMISSRGIGLDQMKRHARGAEGDVLAQGIKTPVGVRPLDFQMFQVADNGTLSFMIGTHSRTPLSFNEKMDELYLELYKRIRTSMGGEDAIVSAVSPIKNHVRWTEVTVGTGDDAVRIKVLRDTGIYERNIADRTMTIEIGPKVSHEVRMELSEQIGILMAAAL